MFHSSEKQVKVGKRPLQTGNCNTSYNLPTNNTSPQTLGIPKDLRTFCGRGRRDRTLGLRFWRSTRPTPQALDNWAQLVQLFRFKMHQDVW